MTTNIHVPACQPVQPTQHKENIANVVASQDQEDSGLNKESVQLGLIISEYNAKQLLCK